MADLQPTAGDAVAPLTIVHRDCPLCGRDNTDRPASRYSRPPWQLRDCVQCRFVYLDSAPDYSHLVKELDWSTTYAAEAERRRVVRPISFRLSRLTRFRLHLLPKRRVSQYVLARQHQGRVLDVGCGTGGALSDLPESFTPYGIEISERSAAEADHWFRSKGGFVVHAPALEGLGQFPPEHFTAVTMRSFLEHELHPLPVLREVFRVLAPTGLAVVKVPNYASLNRRIAGSNWCGFRFPDHLNYFTPATLRAMAAAAGLHVAFGPTDRLPTSDNMWATLYKGL